MLLDIGNLIKIHRPDLLDGRQVGKSLGLLFRVGHIVKLDRDALEQLVVHL